MVNRKKIESTGFHEAELRHIEMRDNHIFLRFDNIIIDIDGNDCYRADLDFTDVSTVVCDDEIVDALQMEGEGSSVIQFDYSDKFAALVVDWRHYRERRSETKSYSFNFETLSFRFERQDCKTN